LNQTDTYTYDANSNLTQSMDAAGKTTTATYDALNRLSGQTAPDNGTLAMTYRPDDSIATLTDPKNLTTTYTYNGFGDLIKLESPDTGTSLVTRDKAGNATQYTDARGQVSTMSYDALNRLMSVSYAQASAQNVSILYDNCTQGIGKPCLVTDASGSYSYSYNAMGRLASKTYTNGGLSQTVSYGYSAAGQLNAITYPSGRKITYSYTNDKIASVSSQDSASGPAVVIAHSIDYAPMSSQLKGYTWGNGASYAQNFNADGLVSSITAPNAYPVNKSYGYDSRYNITALTESGSATRSSSASYDDKSRITQYSYGTTDINDYTYNTSDDRTSQKFNSNATNVYGYSSTSHRLTNITGSSPHTMTYDANGNVLTADGKTYTYNGANRMASSNNGSLTTNYLVNFMGQRTHKSSSTSTTWFIYDENDHLIAEYDGSGNLINEYVYLNDRPIALLRSNNLYYVYTDHLGTPRAITDTNNALQWTWENKEAFGNNSPVEVVAGFQFNLRFPGQYFDNETHLNYNIHRDYNSTWGRYMSSDPLGLAAGINTYGYVNGNSLGWSDRLGLSPVEYYLNLWICGSPNWDEAFRKAEWNKRGHFDLKDPLDADNRTAAEHYIFGRAMGNGNVGLPVMGVYLLAGNYSAVYWQGKKSLGLAPKSSKASINQAYWETVAWTDAWGATKYFNGEPGKCSCNNGGAN